MNDSMCVGAAYRLVRILVASAALGVSVVSAQSQIGSLAANEWQNGTNAKYKDLITCLSFS
jgi:hypothetical protein